MKTFKKTKKRILSLVMGMFSICTVFMSAACENSQAINSSSTISTSETVETYKDSPAVNIWTTSALAKVVKEGEFSDNLCDYGKGDDVQIEMARNEYESAQIIISAIDDVKEYFVSSTDLTDGNGNTLKKEAVEFFHQKYVLIEKKTVASSPYVVGEYPEALIPMSKAVEYGENIVEAGCNQGIWLTVKTEHETTPGVYTGTITIEVNKDSYNVPISVKVWDIDVSDDLHCSYMSTYTTVMAFVNEGDASQEHMENANDFLMDFRVINETLASKQADFDSYVQNLTKYKDIQGYYTFLPFLYNPFTPEYGSICWDVDAMRTFLMKLIDQSVKDNVLYPDMVWFYPYWYDEWQYRVDEGEDAVYELLSKVRDEALFFRSLCEEVVAMYDKCYGTEKIDSVEGLRDSASSIKMMISGEYSEVSAAYFEPYDVLTVSSWQLNQEEREYIESIRESGFEFSAYNCNWPRYPRLASHVDNSLVEIRIFGWMMYDYQSMGMLYHRLSQDGSFVNVYENLNDIMVRFTANGDGLLIYPGAYYGMNTPIASTRLHAIRDSLEDYEYLYILEQAYAKLADYYDTQISAEEFLDSLYYTLYADNPDYEPNRDINVFNQIREQVFQSIIAAQSDEKMVLESKYNTADSTIVKLLFSEGCELQDLNANPFYKGKEKAGEGYRYIFEFPKDEENHNLQVSYILNGETKVYKLEVNRGSVLIDCFDSNEKGYLRGSENVAISPIQYEGKNMLELTFTSVITGEEEKDSTYLSQACIDIDAFLQNIDVAAGYSLDIYNPTDEAITFNLYYETMVLDKPIATVTIEAHGYKTIEFYNLSELKNALSIIIRMQNTGTVENPDVYKLLLSNLKYVKGGN